MKPGPQLAKKIVEVGLNVAQCCGTCRNFEGDSLTGVVWGFGEEGWGRCLKHKIEYTDKDGRDVTLGFPTHESLFCSVDNWECDEDNTTVTDFVCNAHTVARE